MSPSNHPSHTVRYHQICETAVYVLKIDLHTGQYHWLREVLEVNISCTVVRTLKSLEIYKYAFVWTYDN